MEVTIHWFIEGVYKAAEKEAVIIVDATRFSSTIIVALANGIEKIVPIDKPENYVEYVNDRSETILAFENDEAQKVEYADIGNSPKELLDMASLGKLSGKKVMIVRSRAGSQLLYAAKILGLKNVIVGSFPNARAVAEYILSKGFKNVGIVCSGYRRTKFALDDYLAAGCIVYELLKSRPDVMVDEELFGAYLAYVGVSNLGFPISELILKRTKVGRDLESIKCADDADIISQVNVYNIVPVLIKGCLVDALKQRT